MENNGLIRFSNNKEERLNKYISVRNKDGKMWTVSKSHMRAALAIYEPSGIKGKLIKWALPYYWRIFLAIPKFKIRSADIELNEELKCLFNELFGIGWNISVFWGTPSTDQKITVQIFNKGKILGYCKIGVGSRIKNLFLKERDLLLYLEHQGVKHIPKCLAYKEIDGNFLFIQSTEKGIGYGPVDAFESEQSRFLDTLYDKTAEEMKFEDTDYFASINSVANYRSLLSNIDYQTLCNGLELIMKHYSNKEVKWGVVHRDFTPWNMCMCGDDLFVFDFEYALKHGPKSNDYWHFLLQKKFYEEKKSARIVADEISSINSTLNQILYLVDIACLYLGRGNKPDIEIAVQRIEVLRYILENH